MKKNITVLPASSFLKGILRPEFETLYRFVLQIAAIKHLKNRFHSLLVLSVLFYRVAAGGGRGAKPGGWYVAFALEP